MHCPRTIEAADIGICPHLPNQNRVARSRTFKGSQLTSKIPAVVVLKAERLNGSRQDTLSERSEEDAEADGGGQERLVGC